MSELWMRNTDSTSTERVTDTNPLPVKVVSRGDSPYVVVKETAPNVTTSNAEVLVKNTARSYALFINDSDTVVYLGLMGSSALNKGIRLNAAGGSYEMTLAAGNLITGPVFAIHGGTGNKALLITEGTKIQ